MPVTLIADSGATKAEWSLVNNGKKKTLFTQGISPYFLKTDQIAELVHNEVSKNLKKITVRAAEFCPITSDKVSNMVIVGIKDKTKYI